jgi:hypothetical protein
MNLYLKNNIKFAPYIWNWYAWSHLIAPHTAAMNIVERHIKIMESFVANPQLHFEAIHTSGMLGGPFINLHPDNKVKIEALLHNTKQFCAHLIGLNSDIKTFDNYLQTAMHGNSMEDFYYRVPASLRGSVELVYDLHNNPQIRFIEALLYRKFYDDSQQSLALGEIKNDQRTFCLSTPYVAEDKTLELKLPFSAPILDKLIQMQTIPGPPAKLLDDLQIAADQAPLYLSLFTEKPNVKKADSEYDGTGVRVRYFGHACVLLQTAETSILVDPALGYN